MPTFVIAQHFPIEQNRLFAFFLRPANVVTTAPEDMNLRLVDGPDVLTVGSRIVVQARRWGLSMHVTSEILELLTPERIVEQQQQGPFRRWWHQRTFSSLSATETLLEERIEYEPPRGILGLTLTAKRIEEQLNTGYAERVAKIVKLLSA